MSHFISVPCENGHSIRVMSDSGIDVVWASSCRWCRMTDEDRAERALARVAKRAAKLADAERKAFCTPIIKEEIDLLAQEFGFDCFRDLTAIVSRKGEYNFPGYDLIKTIRREILDEGHRIAADQYFGDRSEEI